MKKLVILFCFAISLFSYTSCGLMELNEELAVNVVDMSLDRDTIYVMKGESFTLNPVFAPGNISVSDVYWTTSNDTIVSINGNTFTAENEGWATISGISVSQMIEDSCHVCVTTRWKDFTLPVFPYETVIYSDSKIDGEEISPENMVLAAYISKRLCGIGVIREAYGIRYMEIRVGSNIFDENDYEGTRVKFCLYDLKDFSCRNIKETVVFDGKTHGSLSNLFKFTFK